MNVIADLSITPVGSEDSISQYVAECLHILEDAGLKTKIHAYGINVEGQWEQIFKALKKCHEVVHAMGPPQITTSVRVGTHFDIQETLEDKIRDVRKKFSKGRSFTSKKTDPKPVSSPFCEVRSSGIHNLGMYAKKFIPDGTKVIEYVGRRVTKKRADQIYEESLQAHQNDKSKGAVYLFVLNSRYDIDGDVSWNTARYINHSCEPNCETDVVKGRIWITAIRDIQPGEELSYDYGYDLESWEEHPCACGTKSCLGYIVDEVHRPKLKRLMLRKGLLKKGKQEKGKQAASKKSLKAKQTKA